jgi:hypothetical protein
MSTRAAPAFRAPETAAEHSAGKSESANELANAAFQNKHIT